jgi:endonuclease YncB( thermonuclease family)
MPRRKLTNKFVRTNFQFIIVVILFAFLVGLFLREEESSHKHSTYQNPEPPIENQVVFRDDTLDPGIFTLERVIDADTIKIREIDESIRLLCVDAEEIFKNYQTKQKELAEKDWKAYLALKKKEQKTRPIKYPTPIGELSRQFAEDFFTGVEQVKLERDSLDRLTDYFYRPLCYVLVEKDGEWINLNVELVRNGYSPYYAKYGYSMRYHDVFINAEKEARSKKLGIWNPSGKHYPDYDKRCEWWNERGDAIQNCERDFEANESYLILQDETDWNRLGNYIGKEITIFGTVERVKAKKQPYLIYLSHKLGKSLILYSDNMEIPRLFKKYLDDESYIYVRGTLESAHGDYMMRCDDQSEVHTPEEVVKETSTVSK